MVVRPSHSFLSWETYTGTYIETATNTVTTTRKLLLVICGPFYEPRWSWIPAWISNHMLSKVWDKIPSPFLNFNGCTVMMFWCFAVTSSRRPLRGGWVSAVSIIRIRICVMMTSSNGGIFRVTGPLWGEFKGHRWIPLTETRSFDAFFDLQTNGWANNRDACGLRRHCVHYDVTDMLCCFY